MIIVRILVCFNHLLLLSALSYIKMTSFYVFSVILLLVMECWNSVLHQRGNVLTHVVKIVKVTSSFRVCSSQMIAFNKNFQ